MPTIRDVAKRAGVSTATVSAALNGTAFVSAELKERVEAAVRELGYAPHAIARSLKQGRTHLIGLVIADITNPFFNELTQAVEGAAQEKGFSVLLSDTNQDLMKERQYIALMRSYRVDGLILTPTGAPADYAAPAMLGLGMPVVLLDRVPPALPFDSVTLDNVRAGRLAADHILSFGHRRVGAVNGPMAFSNAAERYQGFRAALSQHGVACDERFVRDGRFRQADAYEACKDILAQPERPTALFVANNHMLIGVMRAIAGAGLRCPQDVSIVSIDDFPWADAFSPRLTTVSQPVHQIGALALRLLLDRLSGAAPPEPMREIAEPRLIVRESCGPPPRGQA
jgi:LacI family transcriptional regulator